MDLKVNANSDKDFSLYMDRHPFEIFKALFVYPAA